MSATNDPRALLDFWFSAYARERWFVKEAAFDAELARRFAAQQRAAADGRLSDWERTPDSALALVLLLDQLPRNLFRNDPRAFASDEDARAVAGRAIARGFERETPLDRRKFFYLPYEHSENLADQDRAIELFRAWLAAHGPDPGEKLIEQLWYAERHHEIIRRFGRFPHRNQALGRPSTEAEIEFLKEPHSGF
ncbi:MAG: DUF924 family protein [Dongiaceae bacterium]